jgi:hypothetical protein
MKKLFFLILFSLCMVVSYSQEIPKEPLDTITKAVTPSELPERVEVLANDVEELIKDVKIVIDDMPKKINTAEDLMNWLNFIGILLTILLTQLSKITKLSRVIDAVKARYKLIAVAAVIGLSVTLLKGELSISNALLAIFMTGGGAMMIYELLKELPFVKNLFNDKGRFN